MTLPKPRRLLIFALSFLALTVPLAWLWHFELRTPYGGLLKLLAEPLRALFGLEASGRGPLGERTLGYVPFLVLMAITPGLAAGRRARAAGLGCGLILASHLLLLLMSDAAYQHLGRGARASALLFPFLLVVDALPFAVWAVAAGWLQRSSESQSRSR